MRILLLFRFFVLLVFTQASLLAIAQPLEPVAGPKGLFGFKNSQTGELAIEYKYHDVKPFSQGIAAVRWGEYWGYITSDGQQLVPCQYAVVESFKDGRAMVQYDRLRGFLDRTGTIVIQMVYNSASSYSNGLACVQKDRFWGFIDTLGKTAIKFQYDRAYSFSEGLACVQKNGRYGYIDPSGKEIIKLQFDKAFPFSEGFGCVQKKGLFGFVDHLGSEKIKFQYGYAGIFSNGLACVGINNKYGFIDSGGNLVIPMEFDFPSRFDQNGLALMRKNGDQFYVNKQGEVSKVEKNEMEEVVNASIVESKPMFLGRNEQHFSQWVGQNIVFPTFFGKNRIEGKVLLSFVVDLDGSVTDVEVLQRAHSELDDEAVRVVLSSPKWTPGHQNGKPVKVRYTFPIIFQAPLNTPSTPSSPYSPYRND
ncbi:MAG: TonB family protein [Prevotellaceae bacterium]|jgi:TonB family protein|nr:TonB family protein [Prevotellaceae bacterium]